MRELITTALEVAGLLLIAAAAGTAAAMVALPLGLAAAGAVLMAESWFITRPPKPKKGPDA